MRNVLLNYVSLNDGVAGVSTVSLNHGLAGVCNILLKDGLVDGLAGVNSFARCITVPELLHYSSQ